MKKPIMYLLIFFLGLGSTGILGSASSLQAQTVSGVITDEETGESLPGATVRVLETTIGTTTDENGEYSLSLDPGTYAIAISFVGYSEETFEISLEPGDNIERNIALAPETIHFDELVVIGYGTRPRSVVTAAISSVSADDIERIRPTRIEDALRGQSAGVQVTQSSGQPGSDSKVRIRGIGTINVSDPLYIVDGMAVDAGLDYLNPADIESIEVLKDAASTAVYGARGANGVVLITTKSGIRDDFKLDYNFSTGYQNPWKKRSVLNAEEYMIIRNEQMLNDGNAPIYSQEEITTAGEGTDWQDETFNYNAPQINHQVSLSGGGERNTYYMSFGYTDQEGIIGGDFDKSFYERYNVRLNSDLDIYKVDRDFFSEITVGVSAAYTRTMSSGVVPNTEYGSILGSALAFNPTIPVYSDSPEEVLDRRPNAVTDDDGNVFSLPPAGFQEIANPVAMLHEPSNSYQNEDKVVSNIFAEIDLYEGLTFRSSYGIDLAFWGTDGYEFEHFLATQGHYADRSTVWSNMNRGFKWQVENVLNYNTSIDDVHNITLMAGQSAEKYQLKQIGGTNYDLLEEDPDKAVIDYGTAGIEEQSVWGGTGGFTAQTLASYFGRLDYNYAQRYMFQATLRQDGSSNFGPENKWALFPSFSTGWTLTEEEFMADRPDWLDIIRFRGSWGRNGNHQIAMFGYTSLMDGGQNYYFGSGDHSRMIYGTSPARIANPYLRWEESEQIDVGLDMHFFDGALSFVFDYFQKETIGMLMEQPIPNYAGVGPPLGNTGTMENTGYEFELSSRGNVGDVFYNISANTSYLQNTLIDMGNEAGEAIYESAHAAGIGDFVKGQNGMVFPFFYGYETDGILQTQQEADEYNAQFGENARPGDVRFVDQNDDGVIDGDDRVKIGKGMPDWTFGLNFSADWQGFDMSMFFQGTYGNDIFDLSQRGDIPAMNRPSYMIDRWVGENTSDEIPRVTSQDPNRNWRSSDIYIQDGSFVRLRNVQIGYTLPEDIVRRAAIENLRIFITAENLLTLTKYDGFEPEVASGGYTTIGIDRGVYPQARTISIGANISL